MSADTLESLKALRDSLLEDADPAWQICERFLAFIEADRDRLAAELATVREQAHQLVANAWAVDVDVLVYNAITALHERFGHQDCKRWVEFDVNHDKGGSVHVVLMKPGSKAEEIQMESQGEITQLRAELAKAGPSCDRCQSAHCCSVQGDTTPPLCVTDPEGSLPLWMPWTNEDVRKRVDAVYAQVDRLQAELARVRRNHLRRMLIDLPEAQMRAWWYKQEGTRCGRDLFTSDRQDARWDRFEAALRAALAQPQDGTT